MVRPTDHTGGHKVVVGRSTFHRKDELRVGRAWNVDVSGWQRLSECIPNVEQIFRLSPAIPEPKDHNRLPIWVMKAKRHDRILAAWSAKFIGARVAELAEHHPWKRGAKDNRLWIVGTHLEGL